MRGPPCVKHNICQENIRNENRGQGPASWQNVCRKIKLIKVSSKFGNVMARYYSTILVMYLRNCYLVIFERKNDNNSIRITYLNLTKSNLIANVSKRYRPI